MPKPRRIAFPFVGDTLGGSHLSALSLIRHLPEQGFDPVIVLHQTGRLSAHLDGLGIAYSVLDDVPVAGRETSPLSQAAKLCAAALPIRSWLRREGIGLVHANDARIISTWALPSRLAGAGFVAHQRTIAYTSRILALGWRLADRIAAISRYTADTLPAEMRDKTTVIYNPVEQFDSAAAGVRVAEFRDTIRQQAGVAADCQIVGAFGNLSAVKQPLLFAQALAEVAKAQPVAGVWFGAGDDAWQAKMRQVAGGARLIFMPFVSPVEPWMMACDVVTATSARDGFGRSIVEAMSVGAPVVATAAGGHLEIAQDGVDALLVAPDDAHAMAAAILRLMSDVSLREAFIRRAKQTAAGFSARNHAAQIATIYRHILPLDRAIVISDLGSGGAQRVAADLAARWAQSGYATGLLTLSGRELDLLPLDPRIDRDMLGLTGVSSGPADAILQSLRRVSALRRYLRCRRPAVTVSFVGATNILTVLAATGLSSRLVISERNDPATQSLGFPWQQLRRGLYRFADIVTANSRSAVEALSAYVPHRRLRLTRNQLSDVVLVAAGGDMGAVRESILLAVGRLHPQKGYDLLLAAFAKSAALQTGWRLVVLGEGRLKAELQAQAAALGLADRVEWRGFESDPVAWYRRAGIFVMPSRYEGTPNALLEAGAMGMAAIISSNCGGALDVVDDGRSGLIVATGDVAALTAAIDRLAASADERRRLGQALQQDVLAQHHPSAVLADWEAALAP